MSAPRESSASIDNLRENDFDEWAKLFQAYIEFYKSSLPDAQYRRTFDRILDQNSDLYGLVLRHENHLIGLAHFYPHQNPWNEQEIMHLNDLFVDPAYRGHGYGRMLIQAVANRAKADGCFRLQWTTQHHNPARKLYDQMATCEFVQYRKVL